MYYIKMVILCSTHTKIVGKNKKNRTGTTRMHINRVVPVFYV
jgi:hypothetical protein